MKKIMLSTLFFIVGTCLLFADSNTDIKIVAQDNKSVTLKCTVDGFDTKQVLTPNGNEVIITLQEGTPILNTGAPDLPKLSTSLIIPDQSKMSIVIESFEYTDYENMQIAPSKGNLYRNIDPATIAYEYGKAYDTDGFYPKEMAKLNDPYIFRDYRGQTVVINPVAYNPVTKTMRIYHEMVVKVTETKGIPINPFFPTKEKVVGQFEKLYGKRFLNYTANQSKYPHLDEVGDMLVICGSEYVDQMTDFVIWKNKKGIKTKLVDVATIGNTIENISAFVASEYANTDLTYLLLVGDEKAVVAGQANDNSCDNCYGYLNGTDHFSEIFVGRFNGEIPEQIQTMIDRTLEYEINPMPGEWLTTAIGAASNLGPGDDSEFDFEHMNNIKTELMAYHYKDVYEFYQGSNDAVSPTPNDVTADAPENPNSSMILDVLNTQGASLYNYVGHGDHRVMITGNFDNNAVNDMTGTGMYPFMISVACCVGDFEGDFGSGDCLGDRWIRATDDAGNPTGGIGGCFSSGLQGWIPPMEGQDEMIKLITESAQHNIRHTIGGVVIHGGGSMIDHYGADGEKMMDTWNIFGDPSVVLRTNNPGVINVTNQPTAVVGTSQLLFNCDVEDALIALYFQGELIGSGFVEGGEVNIEFEPIDFTEPLLVTATAYNYYPYQGVIDVELAEGPYIVLNDFEIQDPTGNGNNQVDFGESITLDAALKNVGIELSPMVNAVISTEDDKVTIFDADEVFGDMTQEQILLKDGAFDFEVASFIEDQHEVAFNIDITDDIGNSWEQSFLMKINAPVLGVLDFEIDDTDTGNGNERFDSGETVAVKITTTNNGHADTNLAVGNLVASSPYLTITQSLLDLGTIAKSGGKVVTTYFVQVDMNAPLGESFQLSYTATADDYSINKIYESGINLIVEDFETGNFENNEWATEGAAPWMISTFEPVSGNYCSQSGNIENNEASEMILTLNILESGEISFNRRVSSEAPFDQLKFYIDGVLMAEWSGEFPWGEVSYPIDAGWRTIKWIYVKDASVTTGEDAAWIDDIIFPLHGGVVSTTDLNSFGASIQTNPNPFYNNSMVILNLEKQAEVNLNVYNLAGTKIQQLMNFETLNSGVHEIEIKGNDLPIGMYFIHLQIGDKTITKKLIKQ